MRIRLLGLANTIPLILFVIISTRFRKKDFDERDKIIEHKSSRFGYIAVLIQYGWGIKNRGYSDE